MENTPITLKMPLSQVNIVLTALGKAPYEAVVDVIQAIRDQATSQLPTPQVSAPKVENTQDT
jgi:hypothetical protein